MIAELVPFRLPPSMTRDEAVAAACAYDAVFRQGVRERFGPHLACSAT